MNARTWLGLSLAANVLITLALAYVLIRAPSTSAPVEAAPRVEEASVTAVPSRTEDVSRLSRPVEAASGVGDAAIPRIWNRVEVADYKQYVANLRALGMPEQIIRDIVELDLMRSFGEHVSELADQARPPFWQANSFHWKSKVGTAEVARAVTEFQQMSRDALGLDPSEWLWDQVSWMAKAEGGVGGLADEGNLTAPMESLFGFVEHSDGVEWLPKDRIDGLMRIRASFASREEAIESRRTEKNGDAIDAELAKLSEEQEKAENAYLTPAERHEKELREDNTLINALAGVDLTREEFDKLSALANKDEDSVAWRTEGTPEQAQALTLLGKDRYEEVLRGYDDAYVSFLRACKMLDVGQQVAVDLFDIKRQFDAAVVGKELAQVDAIRLEAVAAARTLVGSNNFSRVGDWITREFKTPEHAERPGYFEITAEAGDTLATVAERYGVSVQEISAANGLEPNVAIMTGQRLRLPLPTP